MRNAVVELVVVTGRPRARIRGNIRIDAPFGFTDPESAAIATFTYEPGARTAWHSHANGQVLIVRDGTGWYQCENGPVQTLRDGDIVCIDANRRHWHGATSDEGVVLMSVLPTGLDSASLAVRWYQHVTEKELRAARKRTSGVGHEVIRLPGPMP